MINISGAAALIVLVAGLVIWGGGAAMRGVAWQHVDELRVRPMLDHSFAAMCVGAVLMAIGLALIVATGG